MRASSASLPVRTRSDLLTDVLPSLSVDNRVGPLSVCSLSRLVLDLSGPWTVWDLGTESPCVGDLGTPLVFFCAIMFMDVLILGVIILFNVIYCPWVEYVGWVDISFIIVVGGPRGSGPVSSIVVQCAGL